MTFADGPCAPSCPGAYPMYPFTSGLEHFSPAPFSAGALPGQMTLTSAFSKPPRNSQQLPQPPPRSAKYYPARKYIAVAVQVVHIGTTEGGKKIPMVARVSMSDYRGNSILDTYVRPTHTVVDFRTAETGIQYVYLANAPLFLDVQHRVAGMIKDKIIVGYATWNFLSVMGLSHPALDTRDLALFQPFRRRLKSKTVPSLSILVHRFMGRSIGLQYEDSLENARASIDLFRSCEDMFEEIVASGEWPCSLPPSRHSECFT